MVTNIGNAVPGSTHGAQHVALPHPADGPRATHQPWESVIRADERTHLHDVSNKRGRCVLCDAATLSGGQ